MDLEAINKYVGKPFEPNGRGEDAYDCWGLVRAVLLEFTDAEIPFWGVLNYSDLSAQKTLTKGLKESLTKGYAQEVEEPENFDIALLYRSRVAFHVGVYINGSVLHISRGMKGVSYDSLELFKMYGGDLRFFKWVK